MFLEPEAGSERRSFNHPNPVDAGSRRGAQQDITDTGNAWFCLLRSRSNLPIFIVNGNLHCRHQDSPGFVISAYAGGDG